MRDDFEVTGLAFGEENFSYSLSGEEEWILLLRRMRKILMSSPIDISMHRASITGMQTLHGPISMSKKERYTMCLSQFPYQN